MMDMHLPANTAIIGSVTAERSGLGGVTVTLAGPVSRQTITDPRGQYAFTQLLAGTYDVEVSGFATGISFEPRKRTARIELGETEAVSFDGTYIRHVDIHVPVSNRTFERIRTVAGSRGEGVQEFVRRAIDKLLDSEAKDGSAQGGDKQKSPKSPEKLRRPRDKRSWGEHAFDAVAELGGGVSVEDVFEHLVAAGENPLYHTVGSWMSTLATEGRLAVKRGRVHLYWLETDPTKPPDARPGPRRAR